MKSTFHSRLRRSALAHSLSLALISLYAVPALAQDAEAEAEAAAKPAETTKMETMVVTGSRIKRSEIEGPAPVTVITSEQIEREGFITVFDALSTLTQASGSTQNDFNSAGGFTPNASVINLRGLGPGRTLLLINGRRAADYPFPYNGQSNFQNFNNIPSSAVDRIEVLAGGASAIYGSDAVAGVVNVVLKTNFSGDVFKIRGSTATRGGANVGDLQWVGGRSGDAWSLTYAFEFLHVDPLFGYERDFMDSGEDNPFPPAIGGYQPSIGTQIRRTRPSTSYIQPAGYDCSAHAEWRPHTYISSTTGATLGPGCGYDEFVAQQTVVNQNDDASGYLYGTYDFDNGMQGWASLQMYSSKARTSGGIEQWAGGPNFNTQFYDPQFGTTILPIRVIMPSEYGGSSGTFQKFDETSYDVAFGLNGSFGERFDWDFTIGRAEYNSDRTRPRMLASAVTSFFLGPRLGTTSGITGIPNGIAIYQLNLDRFYGALTPEEYASISTQVVYDSKSYNNTANFAVTGDLFELPAGPVGIAAIVETTQQGYTLDSDERLLPARREIYNLTGTGGGGDRDRYAVGAEVSVPIVDSLKLSLAGRFDKYDDITDVDNATTWNAGLEWRPFESLLLRGTHSTSFKAPDMHFVFAEQSGGFSTVFDTFRCLSDGFTAAQCGTANARYSYSAFSVRQGQPSLKEETGDSSTIGFVWDIMDDLSVQADYYEVELTDTIGDLSSSFTLDAEAGCLTGLTRNRQPYEFAPDSAFCQAILTRVDRLSSPGSTQDGQISEIRSGPINRALLATKGIDASVTYRFDTDRLGAFSWSTGWSHTLEQETREFENDPIISYRDSLTNFDFRSRVRSTLNWQLDTWSASVFMLRLGSLPNWQETGRIAPATFWNLNVGKQLSKDLKVTLFVNNVFDKIAPRDDGFNSYPYFWRAFDPVGREIALQADIAFD